jgi:hypothetical protein
MRVVARVERNDRFARVYHRSGARESICLACFATIQQQGFQVLEDAERLHYEVCAEILKPWGGSVH